MTQFTQCVHDGMWNEFCEICAVFLQPGGRGELNRKGRWNRFVVDAVSPVVTEVKRALRGFHCNKHNENYYLETVR